MDRMILSKIFSLNPLTDISLGGLQRVQFKVILFHFLFDVSSKIAGSLCPFDGGLTIGLTIGTRFVCHHTITPSAGFHGGITSPTVVGTAVLPHEDTFCSHLDGLTNHGNQPPFSMD